MPYSCREGTDDCFLSGKFGEDVSKAWFKTTVRRSRSGESSDIEKSELEESKESKGRYMGMIWKAGSNGKLCCGEAPCWRLILLPWTETECKEHGLGGAWSWQMFAAATNVQHLKQRISTQWQLFFRDYYNVGLWHYGQSVWQREQVMKYGLNDVLYGSCCSSILQMVLVSISEIKAQQWCGARVMVPKGYSTGGATYLFQQLEETGATWNIF